MKKLPARYLLFLTLSINSISFGQAPLSIAENTLKFSSISEEIFYYGFAEGDKLIFDFEVIKGTDLKEIQISELNGVAPIFTDYESSGIINKEIQISKTGIYSFRFKNGSLRGKICRFHIQRIPTESSKNFNSTVYFKTVYDTTYSTIQQRYLISKDTVIHNLTDRVEKVHSNSNVNGNKNTFNFTLPQNTVAWSYYVGVDQAGQEALETASKKLTSLDSPILKIAEYNPLAALALGLACYIPQLQSGEDVNYYITDSENTALFRAGNAFSCYKKGQVINDFSQMTSLKSGTYNFCLSNDNLATGIFVTVKITAVSVTENWGTRPVEKMNISSREVGYLKN